MPLNPTVPTCTANLKTCPIARGGCGYRYQKGDTKWQDGGSCPQCGFPRRCPNPQETKINQTVCWKHGVGSHKRGTHPVPKNNQAKIFLPSRMADTYVNAIKDPKLREYDSDLALLKSIEIDLRQRLDTGESGAAWKEIGIALPQFTKDLINLWKSFQQAQVTLSRNPTSEEAQQRSKDTLQAIGAFIIGDRPAELTAIIQRGRSDWAIRDELRVTVEAQGRTKERDMKRSKDLKAMVALDHFIKFAESFAGIVEKHIQDQHLRNAIGYDVQQLFEHDGFTVDLSQEGYKALLLEE